MASTPDPFLPSSWNLKDGPNCAEYLTFCNVFAVELQSKPRNKTEEDDLNCRIDKFITLLHHDPIQPFSFWYMALTTMTEVLKIDSGKDGKLEGAPKNQYCRRLNQGVRDLF